MSLTDKRNAYKGFFLGNEHGKELMVQILETMQRNIDKAMSESSLNILDRAKGNQEILDLINNVLKTEVKEKE